jgi:hypothetical protein
VRPKKNWEIPQKSFGGVREFCLFFVNVALKFSGYILGNEMMSFLISLKIRIVYTLTYI